MKILCCGSRSYLNRAFIRSVLVTYPADSEVIHGGAQGADQTCAAVAATLGMRVTVFHPDWDTHGKAAGPIRNLAMLDEKPDEVLAFWNGISKGTKHTIDEAKRRGIPVKVLY